MKGIILSTIISFFLLESCNKTPATPDPTNPPDSTGTASDTVYLRKTQIIHFYDPSGIIIIDSNSTKWTYDNQRRVVLYLYVASHGTYIDSTTYFYSQTQKRMNTVTYLKNSLEFKTTETSFLNSSGNVDSTVTNFLYPIVTSPGAVRYFYYDANGNNTLTEDYNIYNNAKSLQDKIRHVYTNNSLDSVIQSDQNGIISSIDLFTNGNLISNVSYVNGSMTFANNNTYENTLSGGFYGYAGDRNLLKTFTQTFPSLINETLTYTFDKSNRVSNVSRSKSNVIYAKEIYTYY